MTLRSIGLETNTTIPFSSLLHAERPVCAFASAGPLDQKESESQRVVYLLMFVLSLSFITAGVDMH